MKNKCSLIDSQKIYLLKTWIIRAFLSRRIFLYTGGVGGSESQIPRNDKFYFSRKKKKSLGGPAAWKTAKIGNDLFAWLWLQNQSTKIAP